MPSAWYNYFNTRKLFLISYTHMFLLCSFVYLSSFMKIKQHFCVILIPFDLCSIQALFSAHLDYDFIKREK